MKRCKSIAIAAKNLIGDYWDKVRTIKYWNTYWEVKYWKTSLENFRKNILWKIKKEEWLTKKTTTESVGELKNLLDTVIPSIFERLLYKTDSSSSRFIEASKSHIELNNLLSKIYSTSNEKTINLNTYTLAKIKVIADDLSNSDIVNMNVWKIRSIMDTDKWETIRDSVDELYNWILTKMVKWNFNLKKWFIANEIKVKKIKEWISDNWYYYDHSNWRTYVNTSSNLEHLDTNTLELRADVKADLYDKNIKKVIIYDNFNHAKTTNLWILSDSSIWKNTSLISIQDILSWDFKLDKNTSYLIGKKIYHSNFWNDSGLNYAMNNKNTKDILPESYNKFFSEVVPRLKWIDLNVTVDEWWKNIVFTQEDSYWLMNVLHDAWVVNIDNVKYINDFSWNKILSPWEDTYLNNFDFHKYFNDENYSLNDLVSIKNSLDWMYWISSLWNEYHEVLRDLLWETWYSELIKKDIRVWDIMFNPVDYYRESQVVLSEFKNDKYVKAFENLKNSNTEFFDWIEWYSNKNKIYSVIQKFDWPWKNNWIKWFIWSLDSSELSNANLYELLWDLPLYVSSKYIKPLDVLNINSVISWILKHTNKIIDDFNKILLEKSDSILHNRFLSWTKDSKIKSNLKNKISARYKDLKNAKDSNKDFIASDIKKLEEFQTYLNIWWTWKAVIYDLFKWLQKEWWYISNDVDIIRATESMSPLSRFSILNNIKTIARLHVKWDEENAIKSLIDNLIWEIKEIDPSAAKKISFDDANDITEWEIAVWNSRFNDFISEQISKIAWHISDTKENVMKNMLLSDKQEANNRTLEWLWKFINAPYNYSMIWLSKMNKWEKLVSNWYDEKYIKWFKELLDKNKDWNFFNIHNSAYRLIKNLDDFHEYFKDKKVLEDVTIYHKWLDKDKIFNSDMSKFTERWQSMYDTFYSKTLLSPKDFYKKYKHLFEHSFEKKNYDFNSLTKKIWSVTVPTEDFYYLLSKYIGKLTKEADGSANRLEPISTIYQKWETPKDYVSDNMYKHPIFWLIKHLYGIKWKDVNNIESYIDTMYKNISIEWMAASTKVGIAKRYLSSAIDKYIRIKSNAPYFSKNTWHEWNESILKVKQAILDELNWTKEFDITWVDDLTLIWYTPVTRVLREENYPSTQVLEDWAIDESWIVKTMVPIADTVSKDFKSPYDNFAEDILWFSNDVFKDDTQETKELFLWKDFDSMPHWMKLQFEDWKWKMYEVEYRENKWEKLNNDKSIYHWDYNISTFNKKIIKKDLGDYSYDEYIKEEADFIKKQLKEDLQWSRLRIERNQESRDIANSRKNILDYEWMKNANSEIKGHCPF